MCTHYETSVSKIINKFPFNNNTIKQLAFLDPRNRDKTSINGIIQLASRFITFSPDEMDTLSLEFRDYRASALDQLPAFDLKEVEQLITFGQLWLKFIQSWIWKYIGSVF